MGEPIPWDDHELRPVLGPIVASLGLDTRARACTAAVCTDWAQAVHRAFPPSSPGLRLGYIPSPISKATYEPGEHVGQEPDAEGFYYPHPKCGTISPDRVHAAVSFNSGHVVVYKVATGDPVHILNPKDTWIEFSTTDSVRFNRDGSLLLTGGNETGRSVVVHRVSDGALLFRIDVEEDRWDVRGDFGPLASNLIALTQAPDGYAISLCSATTGEILRTIPTPIEMMQHIRFSPDGTLLAATSSGEADAANWLFVYDVETGNEVATLDEGSVVLDLVWSPDGTRIATITDLSMHVWNVTPWVYPKPWKMHMNIPLPGSSVDWSADGRLLLATSKWKKPAGWQVQQTHVHVIDAATGLQRRFFRHEGDASNAAFSSPDGRVITLFRANERYPPPTRGERYPPERAVPAPNEFESLARVLELTSFF